MPAKSKKPKRKKPPPTTDAKQSSRFLAMAKKLEVDESGEAFLRVFDAVAKKPK